MRLVPKTLVRLGLSAVAVLGLATSGCDDPAAPVPSTPSSSPSTPRLPSSTSPTTASGSSDGLTVRYLGDDGTVKTVHVEDFHR